MKSIGYKKIVGVTAFLGVFTVIAPAVAAKYPVFQKGAFTVTVSDDAGLLNEHSVDARRKAAKKFPHCALMTINSFKRCVVTGNPGQAIYYRIYTTYGQDKSDKLTLPKEGGAIKCVGTGFGGSCRIIIPDGKFKDDYFNDQDKRWYTSWKARHPK